MPTMLLNKPVNTIKWEYSSTDISSVFGNSYAIDYVYTVSNNNSGFLSYSPLSFFNSLFFLSPNKTYIIVLKNFPHQITITASPLESYKTSDFSSGNIDMIEYKGSNILISNLPEDYLSQYKTIYSLNPTGNGFVSYSTENEMSIQNGFNTLTEIKNNDILILEKTNNDSITLYDSESNFPESLNSITGGPSYCQAPALWRVNPNNGQAFCYNPDDNPDSFDPMDIQPEAESVILNEEFETGDCQGGQRSGLILLNGDARFVDFAPCGCYVDAPFSPIDLALLVGGSLFLALRGLQVSKLNKFKRIKTKEMDGIQKGIDGKIHQRYIAEQTAIHYSQLYISLWRVIKTLEDELDELIAEASEFNQFEITSLRNQIDALSAIADDFIYTRDTELMVANTVQGQINALIQEETITKDTLDKINNAISNPSLIGDLFPEIVASASAFMSTIIAAATIVIPKICQDGVVLNQNTCICSSCSDPDKILCDKINTFTPETILIDYDLQNYCFSCCEGLIPNSMPSFPDTLCSCGCLPNKELKTCLTAECGQSICADPEPDAGQYNPIFGTSKYAWNATTCEWVCKNNDCVTVYRAACQ